MTKSATATPGFVDGHVSTVNMEGSYRHNKKGKRNACCTSSSSGGCSTHNRYVAYNGHMQLSHMAAAIKLRYTYRMIKGD